VLRALAPLLGHHLDASVRAFYGDQVTGIDTCLEERSGVTVPKLRGVAVDAAVGGVAEVSRNAMLAESAHVLVPGGRAMLGDDGPDQGEDAVLVEVTLLAVGAAVVSSWLPTCGLGRRRARAARSASALLEVERREKLIALCEFHTSCQLADHAIGSSGAPHVNASIVVDVLGCDLERWEEVTIVAYDDDPRPRVRDRMQDDVCRHHAIGEFLSLVGALSAVGALLVGAATALLLAPLGVEGLLTEVAQVDACVVEGFPDPPVLVRASSPEAAVVPHLQFAVVAIGIAQELHEQQERRLDVESGQAIGTELEVGAVNKDSCFHDTEPPVS